MKSRYSNTSVLLPYPNSGNSYEVLTHGTVDGVNIGETKTFTLNNYGEFRFNADLEGITLIQSFCDALCKPLNLAEI